MLEPQSRCLVFVGVTTKSDMRTDTEIRVQGLRALVEVLGIVEAEKFISLILREPFDYTKWQQNLWPDRNVTEISNAAMESRSMLDKQI